MSASVLPEAEPAVPRRRGRQEEDDREQGQENGVEEAEEEEKEDEDEGHKEDPAALPSRDGKTLWSLNPGVHKLPQASFLEPWDPSALASQLASDPTSSVLAFLMQSMLASMLVHTNREGRNRQAPVPKDGLGETTRKTTKETTLVMMLETRWRGMTRNSTVLTMSCLGDRVQMTGTGGTLTMSSSWPTWASFCCGTTRTRRRDVGTGNETRGAAMTGGSRRMSSVCPPGLDRKTLALRQLRHRPVQELRCALLPRLRSSLGERGALVGRGTLVTTIEKRVVGV